LAKKSEHSHTSLVIVESPTKAKTINRYLGPGYTVMASMGHVRDLPPNDLGVDIENNFEPVYQILADKKKVVADLKKAAGKAGTVFLATDMDREGEAIAWHLLQGLDLDPRHTHRVVFNEITKSAIATAFANPHELDLDKIKAQQARRLLDRIVGYQLSPLLQAKIGRGLSAGRVQSVAVRLIVEREREIRAFVPEESWRVFACFATDPAEAESHRKAWAKFHAKSSHGQEGRTNKERNAWLSKHGCLHAELVKLRGKEFNVKDVSEVRPVAEALGFVLEKVVEQPWTEYSSKGLKTVVLEGRTEPKAGPAFRVQDIQTRRTTARSSAPFTTATLQQAASSSLGFAPSRTMRVAQQLYEGVDLGGSEGQVGLITYMRTDSTNLSRDSVEAVRHLIQSQYGAAYLPASPNLFSKAKRAQEAHEAIRPSEASRSPEAVRGHLSAEQLKLYDLIWRRFVACQMTPAQWDSTSILIAADTACGEAVFRTSGRRLVFDGYLRVMGASDTAETVLPEIKPGSEASLLELSPKQQYTSPPSRYSEASLIKKMEAEGIGRPSTYAAVIQTIQDRGYVDLVEKQLRPTARGEVVTEKLVEHFPTVMDVKFTSYMEEELDKIEEAHLEWVHVLNEFYGPFKESLDRAQVSMEPARAEPSDYTCPKCSKAMVYRLGKNGRFLSCTGYPECKAAMSIDAEGKPIADVVADEPCAVCGNVMVLKTSRLGPFLGCASYPDCRNTLPCDDTGTPLRKIQPEDIRETCDECHSAMAVKFARGRSFLGCTGYPKCKATKPMPSGIYVERPKPEEAGVGCDKCGRPMVKRKGRRGPFLSCSGFPRCRNAMPLEKLDYLRGLAEEGKIPSAPPETNGRNGRAKSARAKGVKVDVASLGNPPSGFAWTRTGRPVVETWPEDSLKCPDCGREMAAKTGRFGPYFGCSGYPKCSFVANLRGEAKKRAETEVPGAARPKPIPTSIRCDECGESMLIRTGRSGPFLGCSKYPKCRSTKPLPEGTTANELAAAAT